MCAIRIYTVPILCVLGLVGNTISIVVLNKERRREKTIAFLLQVLAIVDNVFLVSCLCIQTLKTTALCIDGVSQPFRDAIPYLEFWARPVASITQMMGVWMTVMVTVDRYTALCSPFSKFRICIKRNLTKLTLLLVIVIIIYNIPRFFEVQLQEGWNDVENRTQVTLKTTLTGAGLHNYKAIYHLGLFFIFRLFLPLSILIILNIKLIQVLQVATRERYTLTNQRNNRKEAFTLSIILVTTVCVVCQLPDLVVRSLWVIKENGWIYVSDETYGRITAVSKLLQTLNSSVNFIIYCLSGRQFRNNLKALFCKADNNKIRYALYLQTFKSRTIYK